MKKMIDRHSRKLLVLLLTLTGVVTLSATQVVMAQEGEDDSPKPAKLFSTNDTLKLSITAPWKKLNSDEKYQGTYDAKLEYTNDAGESVSLPLTVERRGITRQRVCRYPPVKLRFEKEVVKGTTFRGQDSLKMVTHCERDSKYEQYYILEQLAYLMYNQITDYSFRVRPLSITYIDSGSGNQDEDRFAFLIEDDSDVAKRNDLKKLVIPRIGPSWLEEKTASEFALFQYMIGNVDWAALSGPDPEECCHNVKLISTRPRQKGDPIYPIPYDFDSAGIVDADYAAPPPGLPIKSVKQRLYRGYCAHNETMEDARNLIIGKEQEIYALVNDEALLNEKSTKKTLKYLDSFFETIKDDKDWQKKIIKKCRK